MLAASAFALPLTLTPPAHAYVRYCTDPHTWGRACFQPAGEIMYVYDDDADGHHVRGVAFDGSVPDNTPLYTCANTKGAGTVQECNFSFPEGHLIHFQARLHEGDFRLDESRWKSAYA
ncbi:hypothetical protein [Actinomadura rugatobispora]|uniref:Uncharacterized protein n=1 Tax=Actinomadura rugatobispora TaxID=1994 RepID=A0ABW1A0D3_9ACTN